ncbi:hypothetical protein FJTKL_09569 [Diaporthe vaccinii]|uniref:Uncharacterized protein n=1 Tax=Diaporthe vaccinii TaxID=105482 RepID=A0ABR4EN92_9PEZI
MHLESSNSALRYGYSDPQSAIHVITSSQPADQLRHTDLQTDLNARENAHFRLSTSVNAASLLQSKRTRDTTRGKRRPRRPKRGFFVS